MAIKNKAFRVWLAFLLAVISCGAAQAAPSNDNLTNAASIGGPQGSVSGNVSSATAESGEPSHAGQGPARSVWYRWKPVSGGLVNFHTEGSTLDTWLSIYTGPASNPSFGALDSIGENDDANGSSSAISFIASAGTTYYIAVDGLNSSDSSFELHWLQPDGTPDPTPTPIPPNPTPTPTPPPGGTTLYPSPPSGTGLVPYRTYLISFPYFPSSSPSASAKLADVLSIPTNGGFSLFRNDPVSQTQIPLNGNSLVERGEALEFTPFTSNFHIKTPSDDAALKPMAGGTFTFALRKATNPPVQGTAQYIADPFDPSYNRGIAWGAGGDGLTPSSIDLPNGGGHYSSIPAATAAGLLNDSRAYPQDPMLPFGGGRVVVYTDLIYVTYDVDGRSTRPHIWNFTPKSGPIGTQVTITGDHFSGVNKVTIGNVVASFSISSANTILATVPVGARTGPIRLFNANDDAYSRDDFTVTFPKGEPDVRVRLSSNTTDWRGGGIINATGEGQSISAQVDPGGTASYVVRVDNVGDGPGAFKLTAPPSNSNWEIHYFEGGTTGAEITGAITTTGWTTAALSIGVGQNIRVEVKAVNIALLPGTIKSLLIKAEATSGVAPADVVETDTTVKGQKVARIKYRFNTTEAWQIVPFEDEAGYPLTIDQNQWINFKAVKERDDLPWPDAKPAWHGPGSIEGTFGEENWAVYTFYGTDGMKSLSVECNNTISTKIKLRARWKLTVGSYEAGIIAGGQPLNQASTKVWAKVVDEQGQPVSQRTVTFKSTYDDATSAGSFTAPINSNGEPYGITNASGVAEATLISSRKIGTATVKASTNDLYGLLREPTLVFFQAPDCQVDFGGWVNDSNGQMHTSVTITLTTPTDGQPVSQLPLKLRKNVLDQSTGQNAPSSIQNVAQLDAITGSSNNNGVFQTTLRWTPPAQGSNYDIYIFVDAPTMSQ